MSDDLARAMAGQWADALGMKPRKDLNKYVDKLNQSQLAQMADARERDTSAKVADYFYESMVQAPIDVLYGLEDVVQGRVDPTSQEGIGKVFEGALMFGTAGVGSQITTKAGRAGLRDPNTVRVFAGRNARTADLDALERAKVLTAKGGKREDVLKETGWFQDVDKKWRFEIPDNKASLDIVDAATEMKVDDAFNWRNDTVPLGGVVEHDALYKAYPELVDTPVRLMPEEYAKAHGVRGAYSSDGALALRQGELDPGIALHEIQHKIQEIEGFDPGASQKRAQEIFTGDLAKQAEFQKETLRNVFSQNPEIGQKFRLYKQSQIRKDWDEMNRIEADLMSSPDGVALLNAEFELGQLSEKMVQNDFDSMDIYKRSAGEVEARNVEARREMSAQARKGTPPWKTQDRTNFQKITGYR